MLNEERVKHMVKLSLYDEKKGPKELKVSSYFKKDYVSFNVICSAIWMTFAYGILVLLLGLTYMEPLMRILTFKIIIFGIVGIVALYIVLLIVCISVTRWFYKKKHKEAHYSVKEFRKELYKLEKMYEREDIYG